MKNDDKMLQAVLLDEKLMEYGNYSRQDIGDLYQALNSDNYVIHTVAHIIHEIGMESSQKEIWKSVNEYLKNNV